MTQQGITSFILSVFNRTQELYYSSNSTHSHIYYENVKLSVTSPPESNNYLVHFYAYLLCIWLLCTILSIPKLPLQYIKALSELLVLNMTFVICLPAIVFFNGGLSIVRYLVRVYFKYFLRKKKLILMNSSDAFWALEDKAQSCNFNCVYVLEGKASISKVRDKFQKVVDNPDYERMKRLVKHRFGFFVWECVNKVNIDEHVRYIGDSDKSVMTEAQVLKRIQDLGDVLFEQDKPPWEVLIIPRFIYGDESGRRKEADEEIMFDQSRSENGKSRKDRKSGENRKSGSENNGKAGEKKENGESQKGKKYYALVFRVHHAIMDGISAGQVIRHEIADGKNTELAVDPCAKVHVNKWHLLAAYVLLGLTAVRHAVKSLLLPEFNVFHSGKLLKGPKVFGWSRKIDLQTLKEIKDKTQTTTTSILLSALALSLKNVALKKSKELPFIIHAGPTVAVLPYPDTKPQNRFILAHLPIEIGHKTRLEVLQAAYRQARNLSMSPDLLMNKALLWLVGRWPVLVMKIFFDILHATILVSNVPGYKATTYLFGDRLVDAVGWPPLKGTTGIAMCLFSYGGKVRAAISGDSTSCSDPSDIPNIVREFESEIQSFAKEVGVSRLCFVPNDS